MMTDFLNRKKMKNNLGIALTKEACPVCAKAFDGPIIMNRVLLENKAKQVESLHGQIIGYRDTPCDECKELLAKGFVLIGVHLDKTDDMKNPYRSGHMYCIKQESAEELFKDLPKQGFAYIDIKILEALGFPKIDFGEM